MTEAEGPGPVPDAWLRVALAPPQAGGAPPVQARLRDSAQDFIVEEQLGFEADGGVAHLLLRVEKTDANTLYVARSLARFAGVRAADVGFAGLKDRHAVALQWFSVPGSKKATDWAGLVQPGFRVLEVLPHSRKLRRGALAGNRFRLVLRGVQGDTDALAHRLERLPSEGVPGYFGPQRFGREAANLAAVVAWVGGGALERDRERRAFTLSAARALAFNQVLARRVVEGSWNRLLPGEIVNLDGTNSIFAYDAGDASLDDRCARLDLHPTGPLPGRGGMVPTGEAGRVETEALASLAAVTQALASAGVEASRRALRVAVRELDWSFSGDTLQLSFGLTRGAFATAVVRELAVVEPQSFPVETD